MAVVVVFPCVPATAMVYRVFEIAPNASARFIMGMPRWRKASISLRSLGTAGVYTAMSMRAGNKAGLSS